MNGDLVQIYDRETPKMDNYVIYIHLLIDGIG